MRFARSGISFTSYCRIVAYIGELLVGYGDRKSTRLNSSHLVISYAVFCLKKKKLAFRTKLLTAAYEASIVSLLQHSDTYGVCVHSWLPASTPLTRSCAGLVERTSAPPTCR